MSTLFPESIRKSGRETVVWLDMVDYPIPDDFDPVWFQDELASALSKEGHRGSVFIEAHLAENTSSDELLERFSEAGIMTFEHEGDKAARFYMELVTCLYWARTMESFCLPASLLILSKNKMLEQDPSFSSLREALEKKGFFVAVAQPGTLLDTLLDGRKPPKLNGGVLPEPV